MEAARMKTIPSASGKAIVRFAVILVVSVIVATDALGSNLLIRKSKFTPTLPAFTPPATLTFPEADKLLTPMAPKFASPPEPLKTNVPPKFALVAALTVEFGNDVRESMPERD